MDILSVPCHNRLRLKLLFLKFQLWRQTLAVVIWKENARKILEVILTNRMGIVSKTFEGIRASNQKLVLNMKL